MEYRESFAKRMKEFRLMNGLTQDKAGERIGVSNVSIHKWESGEHMPPLSRLPRIAKAYRIEIVDLFNGKEFDWKRDVHDGKDDTNE